MSLEEYDRNIWKFPPSKNMNGLTWRDAYFQAKREKEEAYNAGLAADRWISVEDRLPKESGRYWCYLSEFNDLGTSHYQWNCPFNLEDAVFGCDVNSQVTHWQPLPEPPKD